MRLKYFNTLLATQAFVSRWPGLQTLTAIDVFLLALANTSTRILYSIFGPYPYVALTIYLSTSSKMKYEAVGCAILL